MKNEYYSTINLLILKSLPGIGNKRAAAIFEENVDFLSKNIVSENSLNNNFFINSVNKLHEVGGNVESLQRKAEQIIEISNNSDIKIINYRSSKYPKELKHLSTKPVLLHVKGSLDSLTSSTKVAVVGTRNPSPFSKKYTERAVRIISSEGFTVVSGLAVGIDSIAHKSAIECAGQTIAVLAHGLDQPVYPKENSSLASLILESGGALISEYPIGEKLNVRNLVARDEWQSGVSSGVFAVESSLSGGTRHAVRNSIKQGRVLGMLNHIEHNKFIGFDKFHSNDQLISLNMKMIYENKAVSIYSKKSLLNYLEDCRQLSIRLNFNDGIADESTLF
ncbi:DNA-processing protein DprA [Rothia nasimurium]|uniref:DNA-processing protein DprA n=1 Tax=Rothia nasimurium TaxID=85336 RepID=UPI001F3AC6A8|nr:DNA-processing protein DprA [Rothia nasimurium]